LFWIGLTKDCINLKIEQARFGSIVLREPKAMPLNRCFLAGVRAKPAKELKNREIPMKRAAHFVLKSGKIIQIFKGSRNGMAEALAIKG